MKYLKESNIIKSFLYYYRTIAVKAKSCAIYILCIHYTISKSYDKIIKYHGESFLIEEYYLIYDNIGNTNIGKKNYFTAILYFKKASKYGSKSFAPILVTAIPYCYLGKLEKAREYYREAEKISPYLKREMIGIFFSNEEKKF